MLSRVQDLPRFKADCERFDTGVRCHSGELRAEGQQLFDALKSAVFAFDEAVLLGFRGAVKADHFDHVQAQERLAKCKEQMEQWMLKNSPNVHIDETKYQ